MSTAKKVGNFNDRSMSYTMDASLAQSFSTNYQVGGVDESGFVHIGIEERQMHPRNINDTFFGNGGPGQLNSCD